MRQPPIAGRWRFRVPVHITGVPSGSGRKKTDPLSKKVSKELSLDIL
jgi:hypothetical protein